MKIAVTGKGGVGKTTLAAGLAQLFAQNGHQVYAVDADPDISLGTTLGVSRRQLDAQPPLIEMKELIKERTGKGGAVFILNPEVDDILDKYSIDLGKIKLLRMGAIKHAGTSCYCPENSFLNAIVRSLLLNNDDIVILDMGAGIEHLTRGTSKGVDIMLIVTEPSKVSVDTAKVIQKLAGEMGVPRVKVIGNKIRSPREKAFVESAFPQGDVLGFMDFDEDLWEKAMLEDPSGLAAVLKKSVAPIFERVNTLGGEAAV